MRDERAVAASRPGARAYHFTRISQIEKNQARVTVEEALAFARDCGADDATLARVRALAEATQDTRTTWIPDRAGDAVAAQRAIAARERSARVLRSFSPSTPTGLVQTPAYATALFTHFGTPDPRAAARERWARQSILREGVRDITLLLTEGAVRYRPGPPVMLATQLMELERISRLPGVRVRVILYDQAARTTYDNFFAVYSDIADGSPAMVEVESATDEHTTTRPSIVAAYLAKFSLLEESALSEDATRAFLARVRETLRGG